MGKTTHWKMALISPFVGAGLAVAACGPPSADATDADADDSGSAPTASDAGSPQSVAKSVSIGPPPSDPIITATVQEARDQLALRDEARRAFTFQSGTSTNWPLVKVSWDYGSCQDAASLLPPPLDGWGMHSDLSRGEWPTSPEMARITYSHADESLDPQSAEYGASKENISIRISSGTVGGIAEMYSNEQLKSVMLVPGPFGYPIQKTPPGYPGRTVLLGPYLVQMDGTGKDMDRYFESIVKCGIENGLIADGVDISTLDLVPSPSLPSPK
ncbi:MAG: hypothetical protein AAFO74_16065 [Pseudomonadota bacterium]